VCYILDQLTEKALKAKNFKFNQKPKFDQAKKIDDEPQVDEEGDPNMDMAEMIEDSEEDMDEVI
jgi:hypothetical protein